MTQNEPNCGELSRIPANSKQFLTEDWRFFDQDEGLGVELPSFLRVFWTKNGELLCISADAIPARSEKGPI